MSAESINVEQATTAPETFKELFALMWRRGIRELRKQLLVAIVILVIGWLLHTFLLVGLNEGFGRMNNLLSDFLSTQNNLIGGMAIWALVPALVIIVYRRIKDLGLDDYLGELGNGLPWIRESYGRLGKRAPLILAGGAIAGLGIVALFRNNLLGLILFGCAIAALGHQSESFWFFFLRVTWNEFQQKKSRSGKPREPFNVNLFCAGTAGAALGFLVGFVLPGVRRQGLIILGVMILAGIALWIYASQKQGAQPPTALLLALALASMTLLAVAVPIYADDGGWQEAGGSIGSWLRSEGAFRAVARGLPTAVAATVGFAIGNTIAALGILVPPPAVVSPAPSPAAAAATATTAATAATAASPKPAVQETASAEEPTETLEEIGEDVIEDVVEQVLDQDQMSLQVPTRPYQIELDFSRRTIFVDGEGLSEDTTVVLVNQDEVRFENNGPARWTEGELKVLELPLEKLQGMPLAAQVTVTEGTVESTAHVDRIAGPAFKIDPDHWTEDTQHLAVRVIGQQKAAPFPSDLEGLTVTTNHPQVHVKDVGRVNEEMIGVYLEREPGAESGLCELTFRLQLTPELEQVVKADLWLV